MPFKKVTVPVSLPIMFGPGDVLVHQKGAEYIVRGTPLEFIIEASGEPAYAYEASDGRIWVRSQRQMEDGRFRLKTKADETAKGKRRRQEIIDNLLLGSIIIACFGWWLSTRM